MNGYITPHKNEKRWPSLGPEFNKDFGRKEIFVRTLYGLNSAEQIQKLFSLSILGISLTRPSKLMDEVCIDRQ